MTSLIKNQVLKHLTKFFKDLAPEQLQLSAFKGSCELSNLQLEEKVLMDLLSFPAWLTINKAECDQLSIKIPWTKIKSVPIQMNLNEVTVEVEVCEEFRDTTCLEDDLQLATIINVQAPGKYGFVDRVIDGITVTVNNVLITFKSKLMSATFNLSRVLLESRCPNWKLGELSLTRIKEVTRGQILLFKIVEWQTMRLEAKCLTDPLQAPLRLITNHAQCRLTIKKKLDDCSVLAARIFVIFEDILWVLTFAQFISAASFVEYIFTLIKRSPMSTKTNLLKSNTSTQPPSSNSTSYPNSASSSFSSNNQTPLISPMNTPLHSNQYNVPKPPLLTGNMSSASLTEQKFLCYDLLETSLHLYIDKVDAHLYDDIENSTNSNSRDSGGALQTTLDQIQVDCYPYSTAQSDRRHWYKWFDPSPSSRRQWLNSHFAAFDAQRTQKKQEDKDTSIGNKISLNIPSTSTSNEQTLSLTLLIKVKDYCMHCVATKHSPRGEGLNKFIQTDKDYHMPAEMPSIYLELNYFYYFDTINRMMIYEDVPDPLAFIHLSPTKLLFDSATLLFLNSFHVNLSKALVHLNDLFPEETTAPKIHCRIEILMPQISLPAKVTDDQPQANTSTLMVKSGKVVMSNSISDKNVLAKLMNSIDILRESPSQPINFGSSGQYQSQSAKKDNSCTGDWNKVWNATLVNKMGEFNMHNQLWALQFEPVWMDFMNYDVDDLSCSQRLEPIVEPVNAYAFIHLNLSSTFPESSSNSRDISISNESNESMSEKNNNTKPRDIISILVTVMDGSILANMDKVQFGFLQRLGMHVEKLFQQIRADASSIIQLDTTVEGSLEINLTAYIKEIKARLILDKKTEKKRVIGGGGGECLKSPTTLNTEHLQKSEESHSPSCVVVTSGIGSDTSSSLDNNNKHYLSNVYFQNSKPIVSVSEPYTKVDNKGHDDTLLGVVYTPGCDEQLGCDGDDLGLDECAEVADDASFLFLGGGGDSKTAATNPVSTPTTADESLGNNPKKSLVGENLLLNLDEMESASSLFAKVDLQSSSRQSSPQPANLKVDTAEKQQHQQPQQQQQQEIETESISYLELSMSQLMVRRITETKRRQKF